MSMKNMGRFTLVEDDPNWIQQLASLYPALMQIEQAKKDKREKKDKEAADEDYRQKKLQMEEDLHQSQMKDYEAQAKLREAKAEEDSRKTGQANDYSALTNQYFDPSAQGAPFIPKADLLSEIRGARAASNPFKNQNEIDAFDQTFDPGSFATRQAQNEKDRRGQVEFDAEARAKAEAKYRRPEKDPEDAFQRHAALDAVKQAQDSWKQAEIDARALRPEPEESMQDFKHRKAVASMKANQMFNDYKELRNRVLAGGPAETPSAPSPAASPAPSMLSSHAGSAEDLALLRQAPPGATRTQTTSPSPAPAAPPSTPRGGTAPSRYASPTTGQDVSGPGQVDATEALVIERAKKYAAARIEAKKRNGFPPTLTPEDWKQIEESARQDVASGG